MIPESYHTIARPSEGYFKDKGSRFLSFAFPVRDESEVKQHLEELRKKYHDARHHCYAYILGIQADRTRANDDGEPSHSAGDPILGQIRSKEITQTLVVVVRYFGGTKLGVSGLIHAYKTAASDALDKVRRIKKYISIPLTLHFKYEQMNEVMRVINSMDLKISEQQFEKDCRIILKVRPSQVEQIRQAVEPWPEIRITD